ncbi:HEAT repeat domain-containing protein [Alkalibacterium sp.]|nr:MAG: HEAT repeat domain-containing protein [Alkalibacterium sp.]
MITGYVWLILISLLSINMGIFIFVLIKKMTMNSINKKKAAIKSEYEDEFVRFITSPDDEIKVEPKTYLEKKVCQSLILDYNAYIPESKRKVLLERTGTDETLNKVTRNLSSSNVWKKKTGTFLAGEYEFDTLAPVLLKQLQTKDNQLLFVTAKSLIKMCDRQFLKEVLQEAAKDNRMEKNQVLSLLELVEEDIEDILEECMLSDDLFLQVIALEELGKRHYSNSVKWIRTSVLHSQKEIRIAALKASYNIGNSGDDLYLNDIVSVKDDSEWEVRSFLAKVLRKINTEKSMDILIDYMSDQNWYVRHHAADSLYAHGDRGINALNHLLYSDDRFAKDAAGAVLQKVALNK